MIIHQKNFIIETKGRGTINITSEVATICEDTHIISGICHVFLRHTSASLILCENADNAVRTDLETFMKRLAPDGDPSFAHDAEGPDDMPSHVRTILTQNCLNIPISHKKLALGTWQGIFLWEHRIKPHRREIIVTVLGKE